MKIIFTNEFSESLMSIENFIAQDSPSRASRFFEDLMQKIYDIEFMP